MLSWSEMMLRVDSGSIAVLSSERPSDQIVAEVSSHVV